MPQDPFAALAKIRPSLVAVDQSYFKPVKAMGRDRLPKEWVSEQAVPILDHQTVTLIDMINAGLQFFYYPPTYSGSGYDFDRMGLITLRKLVLMSLEGRLVWENGKSKYDGNILARPTLFADPKAFWEEHLEKEARKAQRVQRSCIPQDKRSQAQPSKFFSFLGRLGF